MPLISTTLQLVTLPFLPFYTLIILVLHVRLIGDMHRDTLVNSIPNSHLLVENTL